MTARDLINYLIPPLKTTDTLGQAKSWMEEFRLIQLPVVENGKFLGMLSEDILLDGPSEGTTIQEYIGALNLSYISQDTHYYDVLKRAYEMETKLVAVLDESEEYLGVISIEDVVEAFAHSSSVNIPGAILVLSMEFRDYSLSQISRIIESEDAKILSSNIVTDSGNPSRIRLTLKINREEVSHLTKILESKGYALIDAFNNTEESNPDLDRYDALMKYLRI